MEAEPQGAVGGHGAAGPEVSSGPVLKGPWEAGPGRTSLSPHLCFGGDSVKPVQGQMSSPPDVGLCVSLSSVNISTFRVLFQRPGFKFKN